MAWGGPPRLRTAAVTHFSGRARMSSPWTEAAVGLGPPARSGRPVLAGAGHVLPAAPPVGGGPTKARPDPAAVWPFPFDPPPEGGDPDDGGDGGWVGPGDGGGPGSGLGGGGWLPGGGAGGADVVVVSPALTSILPHMPWW